MQSNSKHILLISYVFPPHYGIGGRRWAKHAIELTKLNYTVHVICARNPFKKKSLWTDSVLKNPSIILYQLPTMYPKVLVNFNHNFLQKIIYKCFVTILPFLTRGSYLDRTIFWKRKLLKTAKKIILKHNIKHVISTGGPFGTMYYSTLLRKWFNNIFILNDMRDPWTWGPNWGFPDLSEKRMNYEKFKEAETIKNSDLITVPTQEMLNYLHQHYPNYKNKIIELTHFFDPEELVSPVKTSSNKIRLVYYGNIYHNIEHFLDRVISFLALHKDKFTFDIYTDKTHHLKYIEKYGASNIQTFAQLNIKNLFSKFSDYDFVFIMTPNYGKHNISTKFFEIFYTKTPIIICSEPGYASEYLEKNSLGFRVDGTNLDTKMLEIYSKNNFKFNSNINISKYELKNIGIQINDILSKNNSFVRNYSKAKKNILFTFDYELFLGENSGSVYNSILKPTNIILDCLKKLNIINAVFFVDTLYLYRLKTINTDKAQLDYQRIREQLTQILKSGHFIYPHIHAHWYSAVYNELTNRWHLTDIRQYRFHALDSQKQDESFQFSIDIIKNIQKDAAIYYDIDCYRAGGWCIQPFTDFKPYFIKYGIKNDFSVLKNFSLNHNYSFYNFESFPQQAIYKFNDDISLISNDGKFTEYTITSIPFTNFKLFINKLFLKIAFKLNYISYGDGKSAKRVNDEMNIDETSEKIYRSKQNYEMTSIELMTTVKLSTYHKFLNYNDFLHFISHPKMISRHNIYCFEKFIAHAKQKYEIETDYTKMN